MENSQKRQIHLRPECQKPERADWLRARESGGAGSQRVGLEGFFS